MHGQYIEQRTMTGASSLSWDLAHHLFTRHMAGKVVIVGEKPDILLSSLKKQWVKLTRRVQRERSSTLDAPRIVALTTMISDMQELAFTTEAPLDQPRASVFIMHPKQLDDVLPVCRTIYITCSVPEETLAASITCAPAGSLVVGYDDAITTLIKNTEALVS